MTGEMSDVTLREFHEKLMYLRNLQSRKEDVIRIIEEQGKLTEEIKKYVGRIAPVLVLAGENEMLSLAQGAMRVLSGEEKAQIY